MAPCLLCYLGYCQGLGLGFGTLAVHSEAVRNGDGPALVVDDVALDEKPYLPGASEQAELQELDDVLLGGAQLPWIDVDPSLVVPFGLVELDTVGLPVVQENGTELGAFAVASAELEVFDAVLHDGAQ